MKSTPVRSFGKVFETSLGKSLGKVLGKALRCHVLCLIMLGVIVGCSDETSPTPLLNHIVSPYTKQTKAFFVRSRSQYWSNRLETVQIDGQRCILREQLETTYIFLQNYTLETVPEHLAQGIEFDKLIILPDDKDNVAQCDPRVLEKILSALGTICADTLELYNLDLDDSGGKKKSQRMARFLGNFGRKETPELASPIARYTLSIKTLLIRSTTLPAIDWFQKRLDLSHCQISLIIIGKLQLESLELLDGFNAGSIEALNLEGFMSLDSLECKLLREGPLPDKLVILTPWPIYPKISKEIAGNILTKEWRLLVVPMEVWTDLMSPSNQPKHLTAAELAVYIPQHGVFTVIPISLTPSMGDNLATVKVLRFEFYTRHELMSAPKMMGIVDWISRYFRGLEKLVIEESPGKTGFCLFLQKNQVEITTNPGLKT
ncbi:hypothetical protein NEDG_02211, partial [Nematocida displodere]